MSLDRRRTRDRIPVPLTAVLALGIDGQLGQILLLRELLIVSHGHQLTLGIILASWMAWVSAESWLGTLLAEWAAQPRLALAGLAAASLALMPALCRLDGWAYRLQWRRLAPDSELVEIRPSRYGTVSVARRARQYGFLQSNHLAVGYDWVERELLLCGTVWC